MSLRAILSILAQPGDTGAERSRYEQTALLELLAQQRTGSPIVLYGSGFGDGSLFIHSILVPLASLATLDVDDLRHWSGNPSDSWSCGLVWGGGADARVEFEVPLRRISPPAFRNGEQLVFSRSFEGRAVDKRYFEIAPSVTHAHGLHWTPERHAWCRLDDNGDVENVIEWTQEEGRAVCIAIRRDVLEMQMAAREMALVQMFDSTLMPDGFSGWEQLEGDTITDEKNGLYYRTGKGKLGGSYFRGAQIIRPARTAAELGAQLWDEENRPKQYESFITQDWKNKRIATVSCDPAHIASYFEKDSPLPFHTSPVFFNGAVLGKYKADPEKYSLANRSISCRNAWHLQTYDVNEVGQVHTYIRYLGDLPHSEQMYWKSFNEPPQGPISRRSLVTDFEGRFDEEPDTVRDLQALLREMEKAKPRWFRLREPELLDQLHYPLTESIKEWGDTIQILAKLVNEGLDRRYFQRGAEARGAGADAGWGSILWAREYLRVTGVDGSAIEEIINPLRDLQYQRQMFGAHSSGEEAATLRAGLLREHKSPRGHLAHLTGQLVYSLRMLQRLLTRSESGTQSA